jgi:inosose dehydratase
VIETRGTEARSNAVTDDTRIVRIGIAPIGWTNDDWPELGGDIPFERCVLEMAAAGYAGCELGGKFPRDPAALLGALAPLGLEVASAWISLYFTEDGRERETLEAFAAHADRLAAVGAKVVVVCECGGGVQRRPLPVSSARPRFDDAAWRRLVDGLHRVGEIARARGLDVVYHPHMGTGIQTAEEIDRLMASTDVSRVSLLVDSGHASFAGDDPVAILRRHAPRVKHVHLKDVRGTVAARAIEEGWSFERAVREGVFTVPGDGSVDMRAFLGAVEIVGYSGWLVVEAEQDPAKAPPLEYARMGREFVREATGR